MYKILVISDTHGQISDTIDLMGQISDLNCVFHLGDLVRDAEDLKAVYDVPFEMVLGNCDYYSKDATSHKVVEIMGKRIFLTHGHEFGVKYGVDRLRALARQESYDAICFGHTHTPFLGYESETLIMNPGSMSQPRNYKNISYGIIQIDDKARIHGTLNDFKKIS